MAGTEDEKVAKYRATYTKILKAVNKETDAQLDEIQKATEAYAKSIGKDAMPKDVAKKAAELRKKLNTQQDWGVNVNAIYDGHYNK